MKYYAVKNGYHPGIYTSWDDCKKEVDGFKGAKFKSFATKEEAEEFISGKVKEVKGLVAYVDGSFNKKTNN